MKKTKLKLSQLQKAANDPVYDRQPSKVRLIQRYQNLIWPVVAIGSLVIGLRIGGHDSANENIRQAVDHVIAKPPDKNIKI